MFSGLLGPRSRTRIFIQRASLGQAPPANVCNQLRRMSTARSLRTSLTVEDIQGPSRVAAPPAVDDGASRRARKRTAGSVACQQAVRVASAPCRALIAGRTRTGRVADRCQAWANPEACSAATQTPPVASPGCNRVGSPARYPRSAKNRVTPMPREEPCRVCQLEVPSPTETAAAEAATSQLVCRSPEGPAHTLLAPFLPGLRWARVGAYLHRRARTIVW